MFKHYFELIHQVEIWPIISLSIFFSFFIGLLIWVIRADKDYIKSMSELPINDGSETRVNP
ncbi:cytochrome C oxidase Cbb3 [Fulvivirga sp. M361]|nr:cytochrome C oxidase Cbb3 [Fulvivirga sp. M361]TRX52663.1 cytochrome C oxidase Cbb3 [Fulvivirga sp. M361]